MPPASFSYKIFISGTCNFDNYVVSQLIKLLYGRKVRSFMKTIINTPKAPQAIGPYSQAVKVNGMVYTSGIIPIDPATGELVDGTIEEQTDQVLRNLRALLQEAGTGVNQVIKTTVFIKNMDDFSKINEIYAKYFTENYPARSCVEVARLPKDVLIEIEAIAMNEHSLK